ncbi:thioesterase II family protein [Nocardia brasiliensis]|uniref:thioesterase II family protein n=1 Tax=Nocardia brasiliensis TaxID=37326 RepID=UPI003670574F
MAEDADDTSLWIRMFDASFDAESRRVCLPDTGGSVSFFAVSQALTRHCEVLAVQHPGRQHGPTEKCIENIPELADVVTEQLITRIDRPLAMPGHGLGAILMVEGVRRLFAYDEILRMALPVISGDCAAAGACRYANDATSLQAPIPAYVSHDDSKIILNGARDCPRIDAMSEVVLDGRRRVMNSACTAASPCLLVKE